MSRICGAEHHRERSYAEMEFQKSSHTGETVKPGKDQFPRKEQLPGNLSQAIPTSDIGPGSIENIII